jgi:putative RNA 2'-phosphotransferase
MSLARVCADHGYFADEECPICGDSGRVVLDNGRRRRLSKFMSGALRHFPADVELSLDEQGWTVYDDFVEAVLEQYDWAEPESVEAVIATDPKGRFERTGENVRAAYGHSVDVDLEQHETVVPDELYHGTARKNVAAILKEGLKPMNRKQVHLSGTIEDALEVGRRHASDPVVFLVDAAELQKAYRIVESGKGVYTTDRVPSEYVEQCD